MPELDDRQRREQQTSQGEKTLLDYLEGQRFKDDLRRVVPKHLDSDRFYTIALRQLVAVPDLMRCTLRSVAGGIMQAAVLGLEPATLGECWLIPYLNNRDGQKVMEAQLQIGYLGHLALAWRSKQIAGLQVDVVAKGDAFDFQRGTPDGYIRHKPALDRLLDEKTIDYSYAIVETIYGGVIWDVMDHTQIERIRSSSRSGNSPAWRNWYPEMAMAKVLKRTLKLAPKTRELARAITLDDEGDAGKLQSYDLDLDLRSYGDEKPRLPEQAPRSDAERAAQDVADQARADSADAGEPEQPAEPVPVPAPAAAAPKPTSAPRGKLGW